MLILSRKIGEQIKVIRDGVPILIQVLAVTGGRVRLGITAAMDVVVVREELLARAKSAEPPQNRPAGS